jgi:ribonuclease III family protein
VYVYQSIQYFPQISFLSVYLYNPKQIAEHQSKLLHHLRNDPSFVLTNKDQQVMNRGRNAASKSKHHRHHPMIYQDSTALEALIGYLYIADTHRCNALFQWIELNVDTV